MLAEQLGTLAPAPPEGPGGALRGLVLDDRQQPIAGAAVVVAERTGRPHVAYTDASGRYRIDGIPPGQYVPAAVAPGYQETVNADTLGIPALVTIQVSATTEAPIFQ